MEKTSTRLYWVGGAATAGKTTTVFYLNTRPLPSFCVYDFDDIGMPHQPYKQWRRWAIRNWLSQATSNARQQKSTVIGGAVFFTELIENKEILENLKVLFCALTLSPIELRKRMKLRFSDDNQRKTWLKAVGMDLEESIALNLKTIERYEREAQEHTYLIIDTSQLSPDVVGNEIMQWIINHST